MKIVLLQDVKTLGKKGQIVTVADGYARNFILPKKLGVEASEGSLNTLRQLTGFRHSSWRTRRHWPKRSMRPKSS